LSDTGKTSLLVTITGSCLAILSFLLLLALVLTQLALFGLSVNVAAFLLRGLSWAAYALPLYIMVAAGLLLLTNPTPGRIFLYLGSLPPFAVLVFLVRFLEQPVYWLDTRPGLALLGIPGVMALFVFLFLSLMALLVLLYWRFFGGRRPVRSALSPSNAPAVDEVEPRTIAESLQTISERSQYSLADLAPLGPLASLAGNDATNRELPGDQPLPVELIPADGQAAAPATVIVAAPAASVTAVEPTVAVLPTADADQPIPLMFRRSVEAEPAAAAVSSTALPAALPAEVPLVGKQDPAGSGDFWEDRPAAAAVDSPEQKKNLIRPASAPSAAIEIELDPVVEGKPSVAKIADFAKARAVQTIPVISVPPEHHAVIKPRPTLAYRVPTENLLTAYPDGQYWLVDDKTRRAAVVLKETLAEFNIEAEVTGIRKGPVITMFEILPAPGVRLSKIANLGDNIALRLAASSVRIVAPIPGKHAVGIEVPNEKRAIVSFKEIVESETFQAHRTGVPVVLGKDITGDVQVADLTQTPHLLIAGATGSGKSVCVNSIILSILYHSSFNDVKLMLIDPKVVELKLYNGIPHLLTPVITEPKRAFQALQYCICEMERRYSLLDAMGVRDVKSYNRKIIDKNMAAEKLPYIVVIIDEFADLMATTGKELESTLARLAAMSRAVGIHLVLATQRPSVDVITGLIKANIPSRIAFMVAGKFDSRIIIDMVGAEKLLGKGDMLYSSATDAFPVRIQGAFVSDEEVERVVEYVKTLGEPDYKDDEIFIDEEEDDGPSLFDDEDDDPLYEKALEIVLSQGKASASYLQRKLKIGYNRAARLVELMEEKGIVGPMQGSKARDVMRNPEMGSLRPPSPKARYVPDFSPADDEDVAEGDEA